MRPLKVRALRTHVVDAYRANFVFAVVETECGLVGVGEGTAEHREPTVAMAIQEVGRYLVGQDPFRIEHHAEMLNRDSYWRTGIVLRSALSAVEQALHDIKGQALGVPVHDLLGGQQQDRVRAYANGWFVGACTPDEMAARARDTVAMGFEGLKWDPFGSAYLDISGPARLRALESIEAVRGAVGPAVALMIEGHGRFNVPTAVALARDMAPYRPEWFEEPVPPESISALADVRARSPVPIAAGERYYEPARFAELIRERAVDVLQPDVCHVGGLGAAKLVAGLAHTHGLPVAPHNPLGPVGNAATLHLGAAIPNMAWLETMVTDVPWRRGLVTEDMELRGGAMMVPTGPGLGVRLHEDACARHPPGTYDLRHYKGTLTQIRPAGAEPFFRVTQGDGA